MSTKALLSLLLPPVAYDSQQPRLAAELTAEGNALDATGASASNVLNAIAPFFANDLLTDWERVLNLTPGDDDGYQQRLDRVLIKLSETGGISIPYFITLASRIGYTITIDELQPFRAGENRCGDTIYIADIIFTWRVNVYGLDVPLYYFRAGTSRTGERLMTLGDQILESTLKELKPAHTFCYFLYESEMTYPLYLDGSFALDGGQAMTGFVEKETD
ncbi:YmfQ family protein [Phytobacter sp. V91]|uniref:YmfQ family protein n=1 Tax=Phytobacter sp. V91 TaxID=3369425 RepID=UPI003F5F67E6